MYSTALASICTATASTTTSPSSCKVQLQLVLVQLKLVHVQLQLVHVQLQLVHVQLRLVKLCYLVPFSSTMLISSFIFRYCTTLNSSTLSPRTFSSTRYIALLPGRGYASTSWLSRPFPVLWGLLTPWTNYYLYSVCTLYTYRSTSTTMLNRICMCITLKPVHLCCFVHVQPNKNIFVT